jgi:SagB-type dehydrogenase family enzyme
MRDDLEFMKSASPAGKVVSLPPPRREGRLPLEQAIYRRRSVREFSGKPLSLEDISQLLWAAQGMTSGDGKRSAPSAGALYPMEVYIITAEGFFHYLPERHALGLVREGDLRGSLCQAALEQDAVHQARLVMVITAVYARLEFKYGRDRGPRYVHMEAGHIAQNVHLQAVALGLGSVPVGAFNDRQVQTVLGLPSDQVPIYLIPIGWPR